MHYQITRNRITIHFGKQIINNNKPKKMKKTVLNIAFLMSICIMSNAQNSINVSQGQKVHLINKSLNTIKQNAMGQDIEIKSDVTLDIDVEVKATTPDIHLIHTIKRVQLKSEGLGNSMVFDSDKKEDRENQVGNLLSSALDKQLDFHISNNGIAIENKQSDPSFEAAKNVMGDIDELNTELLVALPNNIKIGEHWSDEQTKDANNKSKIDYTVKSIANEEAVLSFNGSIDKKQNKTIQGMEAKVTANTTATGELTVNVKTGLIKEKKTEYVSKGTTEVMGQNIPFTVTRSTISSTK